MEEDWSGTSEEEKQESESTTEERCEDSVYGWFVKLSLITRFLTFKGLLHSKHSQGPLKTMQQNVVLWLSTRTGGRRACSQLTATSFC